MKKSALIWLLVIVVTAALAFVFFSSSSELAEPVPTATVTETVIETSPEPEIIKPASCIELSGGELLDWPCGTPFEDPGFTAYDCNREECSELVVSEGEVVCWKVGEYELHYSFTDKNGDSIQAARTVSVNPVSLPAFEATEQVIYLTFDDGPCAYTEQVLELLDEYNAKATFFVVADEGKYIHFLEEIIARGHSLGIHCNSHSYEKIYSSVESYIEDFLEAQKVMYEYTGTCATLSRFPGGSRTAKSYLGVKGRDEICSILDDMGIRYFDWNVQPEDSRYGSAEITFELFKQMVPKYPVPISLQHDTRNYSVAALEDMLKWGIENGYEFRGLELSTPPAK